MTTTKAAQAATRLGRAVAWVLVVAAVLTAVVVGVMPSLLEATIWGTYWLFVNLGEAGALTVLITTGLVLVAGILWPTKRQ